MDLNQFIEWQKDHPRRSVRIEIENHFMSDKQKVKIWVYDYDLRVGQFVSDVSGIDLEAKKERDEKKELERLKAKYAEIGKQIAERG